MQTQNKIEWEAQTIDDTHSRVPRHVGNGRERKVRMVQVISSQTPKATIIFRWSLYLFLCISAKSVL